MANERNMTLRYQVKIDKMTSIDIKIILVYLPNNNNSSSNKILKDNQTSKKSSLNNAREKIFNNRVNSIVHDKMVTSPLFVFLYLFGRVCESVPYLTSGRKHIFNVIPFIKFLEMTLRVELTNGMLFKCHSTETQNECVPFVTLSSGFNALLMSNSSFFV